MLEGRGRSTQIGDSAAFFIGSGGILLWVEPCADAHLIVAGGCLIGLVAPDRIISAVVHGGTWTTTEVVGECVIWVVAIATATAVRKHYNEESFH